LLLAWGTVPVWAATLTVNTTADSGAGSLRQALTNAVAGDTITFTTAGTIQLLSNLPTISITNLTINGNGATVQGGADIRIFTIDTGASVTINDLTMTGGDCSGGGCSTIGFNGGGIYNNGTLTLTRSTLSSNKAQGGGGIFNGGTLTLIHSTVSGNSATTDGGGAIYNNGDVTLTSSTVSGNSADYGGAIYNGGTLVSTNSTLLNNSAHNGTFNSGGAIYNSGTATITSSTLSGNSATTSGGGIFNETGGIITLTHSTLSGNSAQNGAGITNDNGTVTLTLNTLSGNSATNGSGGGIFNTGTLTLANNTLSSNSANNGGGILNNGGTVTLTTSTLSRNSATNGGGGIFNTGTVALTTSALSSNSATNGGGGIYNSGTITLTHSTLSGNSATSNGSGGGIFNDSGGTGTLTNSTLSGNSATFGGGILNLVGTLTLTHSTLSGNSATSTGGGISNDSGTVTLKNTLLSKGAAGANCNGTFLSNGAAYNLANDASCGAGVTQVASLGIGTLGANGGPTLTIPLLVGSLAVDAALAADCPADDQRGVARPIGAGCDIGAFEGIVSPSQSSVVPTSVPSPALCSLTGFASSTQMAIYLPNGNNGLNVCYSLITDPAQAGVTQVFTLAADVYTFDRYGSVTTGIPVQVCLQGAGTLLFRDASGQPRTTVNLPSFSQNGFTCGLIPNAGTVILIPGAVAPAAAIPPTALSNCRVTTTHILNLRAAPDATSTVLTLVPYQTTLNASARSGAWLQVVFGSQQGWLSAGYLMLDGDCG
jgi:predicted outer membrane repeat protein